MEKIKQKPHSSRYQEAKAKITANKLYKLEDAISLAKDTSLAKFDATLELHVQTKKAKLKTSVILPHTFGKAKRVEGVNQSSLQP